MIVVQTDIRMCIYVIRAYKNFCFYQSVAKWAKEVCALITQNVDFCFFFNQFAKSSRYSKSFSSEQEMQNLMK